MANTIGYGQGAVNNTNSWGQGAKVGSSFSNTHSIQFDGVDDFVLINNNANINFTSAFSYSVWFKTTDTTSTMALTSNQNKFLVQLYSPTTRIRCQIFDGSASAKNVDINASGYNDGNWHHIAFTTDALTTTNGIKVYYDGVLTSQGTLSNSGIRSSAFDWQLGKHTSTWLYNGVMDEVSLFNSELSATDVTNIYNSGVPNDISSLSPMSWWRFEGTGTTATDSGSGGNNGTLTNGVTRSSDVPT
tara:strand:+ start:2698 stop:3432 length:735 start_codon:yes stop_codon:yes gene_type:complete